MYQIRQSIMRVVQFNPRDLNARFRLGSCIKHFCHIRSYRLRPGAPVCVFLSLICWRTRCFKKYENVGRFVKICKHQLFNFHIVIFAYCPARRHLPESMVTESSFTECSFPVSDIGLFPQRDVTFPDFILSV